MLNRLARRALISSTRNPYGISITSLARTRPQNFQVQCRNFSTSPIDPKVDDKQQQEDKSKQDTNTKAEDKKKKNQESKLWAFIKLMGPVVVALIALAAIEWRYCSVTKKKAIQKIQEMVCIDNAYAETFQEVLALQAHEIDEIIAECRKKSLHGMVEITYASQVIQNKVLQSRNKRILEREAIEKERQRIEAIVLAEQEGLPVDPALLTPIVPPSLANANTQSSSGGYFSWLWSGSSSSKNKDPKEDDGRDLIALEMAFPDWIDDPENDSIDIRAWEPMAIISRLPYATFKGRTFINIDDLAICLANITNVHIGPADLRHPTSVPRSIIRKANLDMEQVYKNYHLLMGRRSNAMEYLDVITGKQKALDRCMARTLKAISMCEQGNAEALTEDDLVVLAKRLRYIYSYKQLGRVYKHRMDNVPEEKLKLVWKYGAKNANALNYNDFTTLVEKMIIAGHFKEDALMHEVGSFFPKYISKSPQEIAQYYYELLGKTTTDTITLPELIFACRYNGLMKNTELRYFAPDNYSTLSDFKAWRMRKKLAYGLMSIEEALDFKQYE